MKPTRRIIALLMLVSGLTLVVGWNGVKKAPPVQYFTGKITEISRGSEMSPLHREHFFILRLDEYPNTSFRLSPEDAEKFGVVEVSGTAAVLTPKQSKGLGWRVKLTCGGEPVGSLKNPVYKVISLERLD